MEISSLTSRSGPSKGILSKSAISRRYETSSIASKSVRSRPGPSRKSSFNQLWSGQSDSSEDYLEELLVWIPPENLWGWIMVMAGFTASIFADGTMYASGLLLDDIAKSLRTLPTKVALAVSVMSAQYLLSGPFVCAVINRYGFRVTGMLGGVLSAIAICTASFLNTLIGFLAVFGLLCGLGFSMIYVPTIMIVGFYFEKWRAIATAITVCGSSFGMILFPPLFKVLLDNFTWREKFRVLSGLFCICSLLALTYRPVKPVRVVPEEKKVQFLQSTGSTSTTTIYSNAGMSLKEEPSGKIMSFFQKFLNRNYAYVGEMTDGSSILVPPKKSSSVSFLMRDVSMSSMGTKTVKTQSRSVIDGDKLSTLVEEDMDNELVQKACCFRCEKTCSRRLPCLYPRNEVVTSTRPMYRDDIFYTGSIYTLLSEFSGGKRTTPKVSRVASKISKRSAMVDYHISVTRVTTAKDLEEDRLHCVCCPMSMTRTLATMLEFGLMKSPSFNLVLMSGFFTTLGMYTPFIYISQYAVRKKMSPNLSVYLISAVGISNCVGRLACGLISSIPRVGALRFSCVSLIVCGGFTMGAVFFYSVSMLYIYASVFGLSIAALPSLRSIILVDMYGLERLTNAFGLVMLFQGIACLAGLPISGALIDYTGDYHACFIFSGSSITISGLLLIPVKFILKWEQKREARRMEEAKAKSKRVTIV